VPSGSRSLKGIDIVYQSFSPSTLVPRGLVVEEAMLDGAGARITVREPERLMSWISAKF